MLKRVLVVCLFVMPVPSLAAPDLSDADRQRLADGTQDRDSVLDEQDGLYVLLRNASGWMGDDFSGDAGAATAPTPDYAYLKANPAKVRGNAYLIEAYFVQADRYPTTDNHDRAKLVRAGDPDWGDQVTRWTLVTEKGNAQATIIVLLNDPRGQVKAPEAGQKVRVAARFFKLWAINDVQGKPFTYPVFVGGAYETVAEEAGKASGRTPGNTVILVVMLVGGLAFFFVRIMLSRGGKGGSQVRERLEAIRRQRERDEDAGGDDDQDEDLPGDPVAALDVLSERHGAGLPSER